MKLTNKSSSLGWLAGSVLLFWAASSSPAGAVTIVKEIFSESTAYGWTVGGNGAHCLTARGPSLPGSIPNCGTPADPPGAGALRLTNSVPSTQAFAFYDYAIPSTKGLAITFDYFAYGGISPNSAADGTTFFLFDSKTTATTPGATGGALGYAQRLVRDPGEPPQEEVGLPGAYVGVGLDEFGNLANDYEGRGNGCTSRSPYGAGTITAPLGAQVKDSITVRGPATGPYTGYCFLANSGTLSDPTVPGAFSLDNPKAFSRTEPNTKRRVRITLGTDNTITLEIDPTGTGTAYRTVIKSFPAPAGRPDSFKFGFASSTGGGINVHEVRNLQIDTIDVPPQPDLTITKSHAGYFSQGGNGSYTLKVQNIGNGPTYGAVIVRDTLPAGFSYVSATGTQWNCSAVGQDVSCVYTGSAVGPSGFLPDLNLNVNVTAAPGQYPNTAVVATGGDSNPSNNSATDETIVVGPLVPNKTVTDLNGLNNGNAQPGDILQYTIAISNNSLTAATGVKFQDAIPLNTSYVPGSTQLNGTTVPDAGGTMPFVNPTNVNSPGEPPGQINPNKVATVTFQVKINTPLPTSVSQISNQGTLFGNSFPPTPTNDVNTPIPPGRPTTVPLFVQPNLHLVKRITSVTRGGVPLSGINLNSFVDDPNDPNDNATGWAQLPPVGAFRLGLDTPLQANDEVEYTTYFLSDGNNPVTNVNFCDLIPDATTFIPNSIQATLAKATVGGNFFSPLAPLPAGNACSNQSNPNGAVVVNLGDVSNAAGGNFGFVRFRVRIK